MCLSENQDFTRKGIVLKLCDKMFGFYIVPQSNDLWRTCPIVNRRCPTSTLKITFTKYHTGPSNFPQTCIYHTSVVNCCKFNPTPSTSQLFLYFTVVPVIWKEGLQFHFHSKSIWRGNFGVTRQTVSIVSTGHHFLTL